MENIINAIVSWFESFGRELWLNFVKDDRWKYLLNGLGTTLQIAALSVLVGILLGCFVAIVRTTHDMTGKMKFLNGICRLYLTVIRGTPTMVQILLIYFGIFASVNVPKLLVAVIAFGLNSGAYVAEIFRSGIMAVDKGQLEAGRSLGFGYAKTMWYIIMPQALKNILPALGNEFIVLLKETSISGYIAMDDLTKGANTIRSLTYSPFLPLVAAALIYLIVVLLLQAGVNALERRLRKSD